MEVSAVNYLDSKKTIKSNSKQIHNLLSVPKRLIKDGTSNMDSSIVRNKKIQLKNVKKGNVIDKRDIVNMKFRSNFKTPTESHMKIEQIPKEFENDNASKVNESSGTPANSRHSLFRLAKSKHSILSKIDSKKDTMKTTTKQLLKPKKKLKIDKQSTARIVKTTKNHKEIKLAKTVAVKQNNTLVQLNKHNHNNDSCLMCGKGQAELVCKNKKCLRVFHLSCTNKNKIFKSGFICPSHFCSVCKKRKVVAKCKFCVVSFCSTHVEENIFKDPLGYGMLCTLHYPKKKPMPIANTVITPVENVIIKNIESVVDCTDSRLGGTVTKSLLHVNDDQLNVNMDEICKEEYPLIQVIKDECDREYIHIGGFNVCHVPDLAASHDNSYSIPVSTDGDLFKPSSANVVIDIESASALCQSTDNLQVVSIATDNKDGEDYANVHFVPDVSQTKNKWLTAEP